MTDWTTQPLVGFDLETTGTDPTTARIVTASICHIDPPTKTMDAMGWLADPGVDIPPEATAVHGVTTDHAREHGWPVGKVAEEIAVELGKVWALGQPVVIYNAPYDLTVLDRELRRHCDTSLHGVGVVLDPLVIDRASDRFRRGKRTLGAVCEHYGVPLGAAHTSAADAEAAVWLALALAEKVPDPGPAARRTAPVAARAPRATRSTPPGRSDQR